jgi:hypothetical protein
VIAIASQTKSLSHGQHQTVKLDLFSSLIEALYDAALDPTHWPRLAPMFARAFGAESSAIFQLNLAQGYAVLLRKLERLAAEFRDLADLDRSLPAREKQSVAVVLAALSACTIRGAPPQSRNAAIVP